MRARHLAGSCTDQEIRDYYDDCVISDDCTAYAVGAAHAKCGSCVSPTELSAAEYGPLLKIGNGSFYYSETNVAGCTELVGETECAPKLQTDLLCKNGACAGACPLDSMSAFERLMSCTNEAISGTCASIHAASNCLKDPNNHYYCWGSGFESQFFAVAKVFCG